MFKKIPLLQELKKDTWVKPFLKKYKKTLVLAIFLGILTFFCAGALMFNSGYPNQYHADEIFFVGVSHGRKSRGNFVPRLLYFPNICTKIRPFANCAAKFFRFIHKNNT